ncbi:ribonuclease Z [Pseudomonas sp. F1_0610]|uniref:ribonuclease Z n=1 Tax=Pseudomonas sp. F1_0610 TaxID=3114284 RepID=UPI0039C0B54B
MKLIFLGTSSGVPSRYRNVTSIALDLIGARKEIWLFDCGEGSQQQILQSYFSSTKISKIFITHLHGDHIFGLPGLLSSRAMSGTKDPLTLYGPVGIKHFVDTALSISSAYIDYPLIINEFTEGELFDEGDFKVSAYSLKHRIESFGFRIEQAPLAPNLDIARLEQQNIMKGPWLKNLKLGETIQLDDGRIIHGKEYLLPAKQGLKLAIFGDTMPCENSLLLAKEVDVMVHETTHEHALADKAAQYGHSTTTQAAQIAKEANVKCLIATHISTRYFKETDFQRLLAECQTIFPNSYLAHDFMEFEL